MTTTPEPAQTANTSAITALSALDVLTYANWFAVLGEPTRVRLVHAVATTPTLPTVGELAEALGISQSTCSHHVRKFTDLGFLEVHRQGTSTVVSVNPAWCERLPHAADALMGMLTPRPSPSDELPADVVVRPMHDDDWPAVRRIYAEGIATGNATFETETPSRRALDAKWLPDHRWVAELDGDVAGWTAITPVSARECYAGVGETSIYVGDGLRGRGVGKALIHRQVTAADDAGLWTLQTAIFPENRPSIALHYSAGYHTLGLRERIAQHHGVWRDTVFLERRSSIAGQSADPSGTPVPGERTAAPSGL